MTKDKKILEAKQIIKEEKEKIKKEKRVIRSRRRSKFRKTKFGNFLYNIVSFFRIDKDSFSFSQVFTITIISLLLGAFCCFSIIFFAIGGKNTLKFIHNNDKFLDVYDVLMKNYYGDIANDDLENNLISSLVGTTGDAYTNYGDSTFTNSFEEMVNGVYEGIGCTILESKEAIKVVTVYENTPAQKAGLKADDVILKVDDKDALEMGSTNLSNYIKTESKGTVKLNILRGEEEKELKLERGTVEIPVVESKVLKKNDKKIGYMSLSVFSSVSSKQFKNNLVKLEKEGIDGLIIDVRGNNGGFLTQVTEISSMFLSKGDIIYQIQGDKKNKVTKDKTSENRTYPVAVLVNNGSASASEILAAAIKESYHGYVVGTNTFGKGTVQQTQKLSDGSMVKYTVENWLTPGGEWINEKGVIPTDLVSLDQEYYDDPTEENDNQLQKALELLSN